MAGALIIHGDRKPSRDANGDIDTLLKGADGRSFKERLLVFQQIPYACKDPAGNFRYKPMKDKDGNIVKDKDGKDKMTLDWTCKPGEVGVVESFDQLQPSSWTDSGRYTSVNGLVQPIFTDARPGQVERWRLVHAGIRDTIRPLFRKLKDNAKADSDKGIAALASADFIKEKCTGQPIDYQVIASDGLTMEQAQSRQVITLQPGYRNDLLIIFPEPGRYCVTNEASTASGGVGQEASGLQLLGFVDVGPGPKVADTKARLTQELVAAAERNMPADIKARVVADLKKDLRFDKFIPHPSITDSEIKGEQKLVFLIDFKDPDHTKFAVGTTAENAVPYQPGVVDRHLKLGTRKPGFCNRRLPVIRFIFM
ncbi:hypothetical protein QNM99_07370 [Pseudomonas sp. PCH446]